jgi:hypothetical protein
MLSNDWIVESARIFHCPLWLAARRRLSGPNPLDQSFREQDAVMARRNNQVKLRDSWYDYTLANP